MPKTTRHWVGEFDVSEFPEGTTFTVEGTEVVATWPGDGAPDPTSRSYCIGLPVVITVHDDGRVEAQVDMSEAPEGIREAWSEADEDAYPSVAAIPEERMLLDAESVSVSDL